jgi:toxin secretion/phage lysis holin
MKSSGLDFIKVIFAAIVGALAWLFGGIDDLFIVLVVMVVADYLTGVIAACISKTLSSAVGFRGLLKKGCIFLVVIIAVQLDKLVSGGMIVFRTIAILFYIANEGLSIIENLGRIGIPLPAKLKEAFAALKDKADTQEATTATDILGAITSGVTEQPPSATEAEPVDNENTVQGGN